MLVEERALRIEVRAGSSVDSSLEFAEDVGKRGVNCEIG